MSFKFPEHARQSPKPDTCSTKFATVVGRGIAAAKPPRRLALEPRSVEACTFLWEKVGVSRGFKREDDLSFETTTSYGVHEHDASSESEKRPFPEREREREKQTPSSRRARAHAHERARHRHAPLRRVTCDPLIRVSFLTRERESHFLSLSRVSRYIYIYIYISIWSRSIKVPTKSPQKRSTLSV